ncbi:lopap-like [Oppia nitens]|uniref:lopap-like n=1 Tax=Oppia nitens TaxID=1686743 RepID=UPI0023D9FC34|nr:lopap-like [Oppia nitens]
MIYQWEKVKQNTIKALDINKLTGLWYAVFGKQQTNDSIAMELNKTNDKTLEFKHIVNGQLDHSYDLVQNYDTLQGKLDRVIDRGDYQLGYPWWVLHTDYDQYLVVYQCLLLTDDPNATESSVDVWTVYSRTKQLTDEQLANARGLLAKAGASIDGSNEILFQINHQ